MGGRFTLSDDSHATDQVGLNYHRVLDFLEAVGIKELHYFEKSSEGITFASSEIITRKLDWEEVREWPYWKQTATRGS